MGEKEMHAETTIITKGSGMPLFLITLEKGEIISTTSIREESSNTLGNLIEIKYNISSTNRWTK